MKVNNIIIVGGGSSGWMVAATLIKFFPNKKITLIESPNIPTVGVGESTLGSIREWTASLNIEDKDFIPYTDASYKLSIKFTDFYKKGEAFHYPFGKPNFDNNIVKANDWWIKKCVKPKTLNSDYADCIFPQMALVNQNKITFENNQLPFKFKEDTAFHFDATKFGLWLRDHYCIPKGVKHIKEDVNTIEQDENGIKTLNNKHKADLFIDCTGFKSLLLGQTLKEEFISFNDMLPNNSAWATRLSYKDKRKELLPYTNCTAIENGWVWNIPLWSRIGTGYVYSDKFVDDDTALKQFQKHLGTKELDFKKIKMRVGIHKRLWVKNVAAIGLSAGFIEPLESNGLFSVHEFVHKLVRNLQREKVSQWDKDNYTYGCRQIFQNFAEFVASHYALSHRDDTEYWKVNLNKEWSKDVIERINPLAQGFLKYVVNRDSNYHHDTVGGIHCIAAGMNWGPTDLPTIMKSQYNGDIEFWKKHWNNLGLLNNLENKKKMWAAAVKNELSLYDFLQTNFYNE
jgi:tryptophan halogenase